MGNINFHTKEILLKLVYYGPGLSGKTTTLQHVHQSLPEENRPVLVSLDTDTDRTIHFDFLAVALTRLRGFDIRLQLYTVPGQIFYANTRKIVLSGADGVVFVADSQRSRREGNQASYADLVANLLELRSPIETLPLVFQYNKRDLPDIATVDELNQDLNGLGAPVVLTVAETGLGIDEALKEVSKLAIKNYVSVNKMRT
jgi:signal recognition particle receptor subunit beta